MKYILKNIFHEKLYLKYYPFKSIDELLALNDKQLNRISKWVNLYPHELEYYFHIYGTRYKFGIAAEQIKSRDIVLCFQI